MKIRRKIIAIGIITTASIAGMITPACADVSKDYTISTCDVIVTPIDYDTKEKITDPITEIGEATYYKNGGFGLTYHNPILSGYSYLESANRTSQPIKSEQGYTTTLYYKKDGNYNPGGKWSSTNGHWNYITAKGLKVIGWIHPDSHWYHLDISGNMQTGWFKDKGNTYYLYSDGSMATGWVKIDSKWYYMDANGQMLSDTTINGYKLGKDGVML